MKGNDAAKRATTAISNTLFFWRRWRGPRSESTGHKQIGGTPEGSEERFRTIFEKSAVGISITSLDRRLLETNAAYQRMLGYSGEELFGKPIAEISHPEDIPADDELNKALLVGELNSYQREERYIRKDGEVVWVRPTVSVVQNTKGEAQFLIGMVEDITERKRWEERLREAEERYRTVVERMPAITYTQESGEPSRTTYKSPQYETIMGYSPQESLRDPEHWIKIMHPADRERVLTEDRRTNETEEPFSMEYRQFAKDGRVVWIRDEATLVRDEDGNPAYWLGVQTDITERKRAEEALRASELRLRTVITNVPVVLFALDHAGVFTLSEGRGLDILGLEPGKVVGHSVSEVFGDEPEVLGDVDRALSGEEFSAIRELNSRTFEVRYSPLRASTGEVSGAIGVAADVTERKRAEEALRRSEASLTEAQRIAHIGNWEYEVEEDRARWSGEMYRIFGFSSGEFVPTYKAFLGLVHPDDKRFVRRSVREALRSGKRRSIEYRIVRPDGAVRCIHTEYEALRDESGKPKRVIGTVHDITERKRADEEIRRLSHYNRTLFEANLAALMTLDAEGTITDVNRTAEEITGFSREKLIGTDIFSHFEDPQRAREWFREVMGEGAVRGYELDIRNNAGRTTPVAYNATVYRDEKGEVAGVLASARDITARRRAEEALKESEERYRRLVELSPELIAINSEGKLVYVNAAGAELLGARSPEELIGKPVLDFVHPDYVETVKARIRQIREEGKPTDLIEEKFVQLDGQVIDVEVAATPFTYLGKPATQVIARDITERKRVEEEIKEANRRLEELAVLKADFTAMVAHELDTPLAVIRGYTDMLSTGELGPNDRDRALAKIQDETDILDTLVADVRAAATVEREDFDIKPKRVPVGVLFEDAVTFVETLPGNHPLVTEIAADGRVWADPYRIGQVLRNLLSNAAKYASDGAPIELRVVPDEKPGHVRIEVADRGAGIHPDDVDRIFEKFGRGRDSSGQKVAGVGLGLYLSRRILQAHGSELTLDPAPGGGSVFGFELKAVR